MILSPALTSSLQLSSRSSPLRATKICNFNTLPVKLYPPTIFSRYQASLIKTSLHRYYGRTQSSGDWFISLDNNRLWRASCKYQQVPRTTIPARKGNRITTPSNHTHKQSYIWKLLVLHLQLPPPFSLHDLLSFHSHLRDHPFIPYL